MQDIELFKKIVLMWRGRKDPMELLTPQAIAFQVLGKGSSENASKILMNLHHFGNYFYPPRGSGRKWRVNWKKVQAEHPNLFDSSPVPTDPLDGMIQALDDEIRAVKQNIAEHPVWAQISNELGAAGDGSFLYEAWIDLPGDSELPIPEGVGILLHWPRVTEKTFVEATLLNYDALKSQVIFDVEVPLLASHKKDQFRIFPRVDELLEAVKGKLATLKLNPSALSWRFLGGELVPRPIPWNGKVYSQGLDLSQLSVIQECLSRDISFVWGPPGTGKTYTLGRLIATAAITGKRVIATSIANVAVDQLALQVIRAIDNAGSNGLALLNGGKVIRFGHPRLPEVVNEPRLFPHENEIQELRRQLRQALENHRKIPERDTVARALSTKLIKELRDAIRQKTKGLIDQAQIILTTAIQVCIEPMLTEVGFDVMVVDEASMMPIPILACMGLVGRERIVVAGDFRQLGPIAVSQSRAAFDWLHKDAFQLARITDNLHHPALGMLTVQRRMHPEICEIINRHFYENKLTTDVNDEKIKAYVLRPLPGKPAVFVKFLPSDGSQVEQTLNGSRQNRASATIATRLAADYVKYESNIAVGLITPYRAQVSLLKRLLREINLPPAQNDRLKIGTVHAFQGTEADVIIWDLVDTRNHSVGKLYRGNTGNRLTNVAISRAQGKLVIIGDPETFTTAPSYQAVDRLRNILSIQFSGSRENVINVTDLGLKTNSNR